MAKTKHKCPVCGHKAHKHKGRNWKCGNSRYCGAEFDPEEHASGRIEGGDYFADPARRMILSEEPDASHPIRCERPSRGGL